MSGRAAVVLLTCAISAGLGGCGERVQTTTVGTERKADSPGWQANDNVYIAPGWRSGDRAAWEAQLRTRAQYQNDYAVVR